MVVSKLRKRFVFGLCLLNMYGIWSVFSQSCWPSCTIWSLRKYYCLSQVYVTIYIMSLLLSQVLQLCCTTESKERYSGDHEPWSCIINSICMKNRVLYSSVNVIWVIRWRGWVGQDVWLVWGRLEMHTGWWENIKDKRPLGGPRCRWGHNIKCTLKLDWKIWTRLSK